MFSVFILVAFLEYYTPLCRGIPRILSKIMQSLFILVSLNVESKSRSIEGCSKLKSPETSSGEIGLNIRTPAIPKVEQD